MTTQGKMKVTPMRVHKMPQNFSLYAIAGIAGGADDEHFDTTLLPFDVAEDVRIEEVSNLLKADTFNFVTERMGTDAARRLQNVRYALVHRYSPRAVTDGEGNWIGEEVNSQWSQDLVRRIAACLRLIRPMRQPVHAMNGSVREDGTLDVVGFDSPTEFHEVPEAQKYFHLRNKDAHDLKGHTPEFLRAMQGEFWKFRMAVQFHELGHFQYLDLKARYLLWASAIESIYTSHNRGHRGSLVAKERIKWFLGPKTYIHAPGDVSNLLPQPTIAVGDIVDDLYEVRNFVAHGDRIPDRFFQNMRRKSFNGQINTFEVLFEASSFIIRSSLLRILRDRLLDNFIDASQAEAYFGGAGLTLPEIKKHAAATPKP